MSNPYVPRRSFAKIPSVVPIPNLIEIQKRSFESFLQRNVKPEERRPVGLQGVFRGVFPIRDFNGHCTLEFDRYVLDPPKYNVEECRQKGMTYAAPIRITVRLVVWDQNPDSKARTIRDVKEQEVYFGEIPLMTETGTFIINGTERVIVSQLHRSPGVFFDHDKGKTLSSGRLLYSARIIPNRGSWLDFEFDHKDLMYVRIDRRRKMFVSALLKALGYTAEELLTLFYQTEKIFVKDGGKRLEKSFEGDLLAGQKAGQDVVHPKTGEVLLKKDRKFSRAIIKRIEQAGIKRLPCSVEELAGRVAARDILHPKTQQVLVHCNESLTPEHLQQIIDGGIEEFGLLFIDNVNVSSCLRDTLLADRVRTQDEALFEIYRRLKPGEPPTPEAAKHLFEGLFFNPDRYDLSRVGRLKMNHKLNLEAPLDQAILRREDILETVKYLFGLRNGQGSVDDIDHLGNRRVRAVGELLENQYRIGLVRMERAIRERMSLQDVETLMPNDLINSKPVSAVLKEFFGSSQLSQFMDQTNPLSEVTHKRRLSALGPGGLTRERAGFEVRDVHATHYGRICPIETPEGPNIGLIASLSTYARVDDFGFIETPYRKAVNGRVTDEIVYLSALEEERYAIAQANALLDKKGNFTTDLVQARRGGEFILVPREEVGLMDVSPTQLVSVAASLIPFLEHDDANRALMGSNMQRQAVPLLVSESPLIGTGMEEVVARDSGVMVLARRDGLVESVDARRIVVRCEGRGEEDPGLDIYDLVKFRRSNQNTCFNQHPLVDRGQKVRKGQVLADGPATEFGDLALGRNLLVAFMPWGGYNFEDSILISERLVQDDVFTSIHIEEFECTARDTKLGKEEITRDIPNVGEEALRDLDETGIVRIGAEVRPGDILVGKITPKGETQLSPEEKLLKAIFGDKAGEVRDSSLRVPPGINGIVIGATVFSRKGADKEERTRTLEDEEVARLQKDQEDETSVVYSNALMRLKKLLSGKKSAVRIADEKTKEVLLKKGDEMTEEVLRKIPRGRWKELSIGDEDVDARVGQVVDHLIEQLDLLRVVYTERLAQLKKGDELPPGVIKMIKVFVAMKRKVSVGDKMSGRHGNKGVVSRILPVEDMPFLEDGTPVDIVLNPLGVPSRMNVGQILETHLGWACRSLGAALAALVDDPKASARALRTQLKELYGDGGASEFIDKLSEEDLRAALRHLRRGVHVGTPVFDGAREEEILSYLKRANLPEMGQTVLFDGRTGDPFRHRVTVGIMYMMKLHHLVDDKIHARSIGPYSLVTQQPLGGKAQFGGQRLGEMEVWALEAYGAAFTLQEFLTVKSDDVIGRNRMYEGIVKGKNILEPGLPESVNVLVKELQSLALDFQLVEDGNGTKEKRRMDWSVFDTERPPRDDRAAG